MNRRHRFWTHLQRKKSSCVRSVTNTYMRLYMCLKKCNMTVTLNVCGYDRTAGRTRAWRKAHKKCIFSRGPLIAVKLRRQAKQTKASARERKRFCAQGKKRGRRRRRASASFFLWDIFPWKVLFTFCYHSLQPAIWLTHTIWCKSWLIF